MERRQRGRARRQRRPAPAPAVPDPPAQAVPVVEPPYRLPGPVVRPRAPTEEEIFAVNWGDGNENHLAEKDRPGRRFLPLPPGAPEYEATFFEYKDVYKMDEPLIDTLMRPIYENHLNAVGDKRREILRHEWRSSDNQRSYNKRSSALEGELDRLVSKALAKIAELLELTNVVVPFPKYFHTYPTLR